LIKRKLSKNIEFKRVFSKGKKTESKNFIIFILKNDYKFNRLGVIVKKEIGIAVVRNKIKRWLKEAYRQENRKLFPGYDIILLAKNSITNSNYFNISNELEDLFISENYFYKKSDKLDL
jgi:ribonuclease P protein component